MTDLDISIDNIVEDTINEQLESDLYNISRFKELADACTYIPPKQMREYKTRILKLQEALGVMKGVSFKPTEFQIREIYNKQVADWVTAEKDKVYAQADDIIKRMELRSNELVASTHKANEQTIQEVQKSNYTYEALEEKRKELESYSDRIFDICATYGIKLENVEIDNNTYTIQELDSLYDDYLKFMEKEELAANPIAWLRNKVSNTAALGLILFVCLIISFTPLLGFATIAAMITLCRTQARNEKKVKYYFVLAGIVFNVKPMELGYRNVEEVDTINEQDIDALMREDEQGRAIIKEFEDFIDSGLEEQIDVAYARYLSAYERHRPLIEDAIKNAGIAFNNKRDACIADLEYGIEELELRLAEEKEKWVPFYKRFSYNSEFDSNFILGFDEDNNEDEIRDMEMKNLIISPGRNKEELSSFIQVLVVNALTHVTPGKLIVNVYDPNDLSTVVMPMYSTEVSEYIRTYKDKLADLLGKLQDIVEENNKSTAGASVQEYNAECDKTGRSPKIWHLLIIMSQPKDVEENEALREFLTHSVRGGVLVWVVSDTLREDNTLVFRRPWENVSHKIVMDREMLIQFNRDFQEAITKARPAGFLWSDFMKKICPEEMEWKGGRVYKSKRADHLDECDSRLELYPGYQNGDPDLAKPFTIGQEGDVHVIGVGGTGAGKSVFLNMLVASTTKMYHPDSYELWLCDFKGSEFVYYLPTQRVDGQGNPLDRDGNILEYVKDKDGNVVTDINGKSIIKDGKDYKPFLPHLKACLCTSDPDYATSLFHALRTEADRRYDEMQTITVKNQSGWNEYWYRIIDDPRSTPEQIENAKKKIWPRILFICDEFQVIFEKADPTSLESINADITQLAKVARAAAIHIFFTSQSMQKTIRDDIIAQFTLRFALRCDMAVSQAILGTDKAGNIREPNGYLYVSSQSIKREDQPLFRTPFIEDKTKNGVIAPLRLHIEHLYDKALSENYQFKDIITYHESTKHPIEEIDEFFKSEGFQRYINDNQIDSGVFVLGERMAYSENKAPDNIILTKADNEHIIACFEDITDTVLFFNTMVRNISLNKVPGHIIGNAANEDFRIVTELDSYVPDMYKDKCSSSFSPTQYVRFLQDLLNHRKETGKTDTPIWVFLLGWDKAKGIGVDPDASIRQQFIIFLQTCGAFNIHVILMASSVGTFTASLRDAFGYKMAGKCDMDSSTALINSRMASKPRDSFKTGWVFSNNHGTVTRDKLYISEIKHHIQTKEIVL